MELNLVAVKQQQLSNTTENQAIGMCVPKEAWVSRVMPSEAPCPGCLHHTWGPPLLFSLLLFLPQPMTRC